MVKIESFKSVKMFANICFQFRNHLSNVDLQYADHSFVLLTEIPYFTLNHVF